MSASAIPRWLAADGPNPQKCRFFLELGFAMEFMALFYELSAEEQNELLSLARSMSVAVAMRKDKK